jgi:hypothetical protein
METDIDCGGPDCPKCAVKKMCLMQGDCASTLCINNTCFPAHCDNLVKDPEEADVDCGGGDCLPCASGKMCQTPSDCTSMMCNMAICG